MRWVALVCLLAACDKVLGLKENEPRDLDAALVDAAPDALITCGGTSLLREEFSDGPTVATKFDFFAGMGDASIGVVDRQLVARAGMTTGYAYITSMGFRDFANAIAQVQVSRAIDVLNAETFFEVRTVDGARHFFSIGPEQIEMGVIFANGTRNQIHYINYDKTAHAYLRIEQRASENLFLTSPDGVNWSERHRVSVISFNLAQTAVRMGAGTYNEGSTQVTSGVFDDFEMCKK